MRFVVVTCTTVAALSFAWSACPAPEAVVDAGPPPGATVHVVKGGDGHGAITSTPDGIACDNECAGPVEASYPATVKKITLNAVAQRDALFANWSCGGEKNGQPLTTIVVDDGTLDVVDDPDPAGIDVTCTATFKQLWTILVLTTGADAAHGHVTGTAIAPDGVSKRIDCPGKCTAGYFNGEDETLTPTVEAGSVFAGWKLDCQGADPVHFTLDGNKTCEAHFCPAATPDCP